MGGNLRSRTSCTAFGARERRLDRPTSQRLSLSVGPNEFCNLRCDVLAPAAPAEDAVVTRTRSRQMPLLRFGDVLAQVVRRLRLTTTRNVVQFAFDREQSH